MKTQFGFKIKKEASGEFFQTFHSSKKGAWNNKWGFQVRWRIPYYQQ